jgi:hypothetical protein
LVVVVGLPGYGLSSQIARALGAIEAPVYHKVFPDGELYGGSPSPALSRGRSSWWSLHYIQIKPLTS